MAIGVTLDALTLEDVEQARLWRNATPAGLRTPFPLTVAMQAAFYRDVVCNRASLHRYFACRASGALIGMGGLTNLQWTNGIGEISLLMAPDHTLLMGSCVRALLEEAFDRLRLLTVVKECFHCDPDVKLWVSIIQEWGGTVMVLPRRKWWEGRLWSSTWGTMTAEAYRVRIGDQA